MKLYKYFLKGGQIMNIKKGDKSIYIPVWAVIAGGIVVESIAKNVCKTVKTCKKK